MRVLIADDEPLFADALEAMLPGDERILTGSQDPADVATARRAGATGYLTKDRIAEALVDAIFAAGAGGSRG